MSASSWRACSERPSPGEPVKQADVVLLGFPLMHPMSPDVRRNDLEMYEPVTAWDGPAMTWVRRGQSRGWDRPTMALFPSQLVTASPANGHGLTCSEGTGAAQSWRWALKMSALGRKMLVVLPL